MIQLKTIQTKENLNQVFTVDGVGPGGACHKYAIFNQGNLISEIKFQKGPRNLPNSVEGIIDSDLLEIVRHRLTSFQEGEFANEYNQDALYHIEEALKSLNKRVEDRISRNVLGTDNK